jgi:hypothetical protein
VWNDQALSGAGLNQGYVVEYEVNPFSGPPPAVIGENTTRPPATADTLAFAAAQLP